MHCGTLNMPQWKEPWARCHTKDKQDYITLEWHCNVNIIIGQCWFICKMIDFNGTYYFQYCVVGLVHESQQSIEISKINAVSKIEVLIPTISTLKISNLKTVLNINALYSISNYPTHRKHSLVLFPPFLLLEVANFKNSTFHFIFIYSTYMLSYRESQVAKNVMTFINPINPKVSNFLLPYWMKIYAEFNLATWHRLAKFTKFKISNF